jgi:tripartite-type tricarboxylate transporter receptor subunit TctC
VRTLAAHALTLVLGLAVSLRAAAAEPRPIRLVVPYGPGGPVELTGSVAASKLLRVMQTYAVPPPTDALAREAANAIGTGLAVHVTTERRASGRTLEAARHVAKSAPDGRTLLFSGSETIVLYPGYRPSLPLDPERELEPVALLAVMPLVLAAHAHAVPRSVPELVERARTDPERVDLGSAGDNTTSHVAGELFARMAGIRLVHVPYNGGTRALNALIAGQLGVAFVPLPSALAARGSDRLRVLAVASRNRLPRWPDVPTVAEAAVPDFEASAWFGVFAPAGTPARELHGLHAALGAYFAEPLTQSGVRALGLEPEPLSRERFVERVRQERRKWAEVFGGVRGRQ